MKILHATNGIDPRSGGPTRSVKGLCRALADGADSIMLFVHSDLHQFCDSGRLDVRLGTSGRFRIAKQEFKQIVSEFQPDLVHLHGLWMMSMHADAQVCQELGMPYVISPRGMLDPWALNVKKWKKRLALFLYQRRDLKCAAAFHATATAEADHIRAQGITQPIIIAPNGVDLPEAHNVLDPSAHKRSASFRRVLFLSRLHPGKGLLALAEAWARVRPQGWKMRVVGPDGYGHKAEVLAKLNDLGILADWEFCDMVTDQEKWQEYTSADLLVHPSVSENFGITIAEGLAAGLPVICTKGTPWQEIDGRAGWWIDVGVESLVAALREATSLSDEERMAMGRVGRKLIEEKYTWPSVARLMVKGYEGLC